MASSSPAADWARRALLALACLAASLPAYSEDQPADETASAPSNEEIIVYGQAEIARRRAALDKRLRADGYKVKRSGDGKTVYRPETPWYPSVIVNEDGFVMIKRSPVRFEPPGKGDSKLRYLWCLPPFTVMCIRPAGRLISEAKLEPLKQHVAEAIDPQVDAWVEALASKATHDRLTQEIPAQLDATWSEGAPLEGRGPPLPTPEERRAAILQFWADRADTPEGRAAREVIGTFIAYEIQGSPFPATPEEISAAEAACACGARVLGP